MRTRDWLAAALGLALLSSSLVPAPAALAAAPVQVTLNGQPLTLTPAAFIRGGRTLAPVRPIVTALGTEPIWNQADRTVVVAHGDRYLRVQIDNPLACVTPECTDPWVLDVPATIVQSHTFVPVRALADAMGLDLVWDPSTRTVHLYTPEAPDNGSGTPAAPVALQGVTQGQVITGPTTLRAVGLEGDYVYFYLIDPATRKGRMVAAGPDVNATYTYTPDPTLAGRRELMAGVRTAGGTIVYSAPVAVTVQPDTRIRVTGVSPGDVITRPTTIGHEINFAATQVTYQMTAVDGTWTLATVGPGESVTWYPQLWANGTQILQVIAYDLEGNEYRSDPIPLTVDAERRTVFTSVQPGEVVTGRARTLSVTTNYAYPSIRFLLDGQVLATENNYWWTYGPDGNGSHTLTVEVTDWNGTVHRVGPIHFTIDTQPGLWLYGVGPGQVISDTVSLMAMPNVPADEIRFYVVQDGQRTLIASAKPGQYVNWTPTRTGDLMIYADAFHRGQLTVSTEPIHARAYMEPTYGPRPIVEKSRFKEFAAQMAIESYRQTGMSAALQVAQAILETGWGQYVPVDKYTGQFSNNLFGIKGEGSAGSIVSTTWEVYNGKSYTVDAYFRAYYDPAESWQDHKELLLTRPWYAEFRAVMSDPILGAWGLRKGGYATDPEYPVKLIRIMKENDLFKLDEIQF